MFSSSKIRVGVLRGGPSSEYNESLKTGGQVLAHLPEKYHGHDIFIDRYGVWHIDGLQKSQSKILSMLDVVFNALHGQFGENGQVQHILQTHAIPFTGSKSFSSALSMNKASSKDVFTQHNIKTPQYIVFRNGDDIRDVVKYVFSSFVQPTIVKPVSSGSSYGISIAHSTHELFEAIARAMAHSHSVLIEEYIEGKDVTCGVIESFRGEPLYALLPTEMKKNQVENERSFMFSGEAVVPSTLSLEEKRVIEGLAKKAHSALGLRHYSRSDFVITPKRGIYILETNTLPGLTEKSLVPQALSAGGVSMPQFLDHVLTLALTE